MCVLLSGQSHSLANKESIVSILNCSSSKVALLLVKCLKGIINFGYFNSCKASGLEFP